MIMSSPLSSAEDEGVVSGGDRTSTGLLIAGLMRMAWEPDPNATRIINLDACFVGHA